MKRERGRVKLCQLRPLFFCFPQYTSTPRPTEPYHTKPCCMPEKAKVNNLQSKNLLAATIFNQRICMRRKRHHRHAVHIPQSRFCSVHPALCTTAAACCASVHRTGTRAACTTHTSAAETAAMGIFENTVPSMSELMRGALPSAILFLWRRAKETSIFWRDPFFFPHIQAFPSKCINCKRIHQKSGVFVERNESLARAMQACKQAETSPSSMDADGDSSTRQRRSVVTTTASSMSVAARVLLVGLLVGALQTSTLGDLAPSDHTNAHATTVGQRRPFLTQRRRRGVPHQVPTRRLTRTLQQFEPIPLYVMLELDTVDPVTCELKQPEKLYAELFELRRAGVKGVMVDVWWGIVERQGPRIYDWKAYIDLVEMVAKLDLTLQAVMSFHQCGGNIGDACTIPLPKWVLEIGNANPDIYYTDASMSRNNEYLSLGVDLEPLFPPFSAPNGTEDTTPQEQKEKKGRTAVDMYRDFMSDFAR